MLTTNSSELTEDHISWLLVSAYTYLQQNLSDRAVTLLEFLRVSDPDNQQCLKMLAYGYFLQGEVQQSLALIKDVLQLPLSDTERAAIYLLQLRVLQGSGQTHEVKQLYQDHVKQFALVPLKERNQT